MTTIDRVFKKYGEDFFGKRIMDKVTDAQVEAARVHAFEELDALTKKHGRQEKGVAKALFCEYLKEDIAID